jgi:hypothetical protein
MKSLLSSSSLAHGRRFGADARDQTRGIRSRPNWAPIVQRIREGTPLAETRRPSA